MIAASDSVAANAKLLTTPGTGTFADGTAVVGHWLNPAMPLRTGFPSRATRPIFTSSMNVTGVGQWGQVNISEMKC